MRSRFIAPACRSSRVGALLLIGAVAACDRAAVQDEGPRVLELANDTIQLESGVSLVEVKVRRDAAGEFDPAAVTAKQGDVVRFTAADRGGHALAFDGATLTAEARAFLETSGQLRSPPLLTPDAAWIITLDGAPAGEYAFTCSTHSSRGTLTVTAR